MVAVTVLLLSVLLMLPIFSLSQVPVVSRADEDRAISATQSMIQSLDGAIRNPAAKLIRLVFHDCVAGCDGCLNLTNPDNNGLGEIYQEVNMLYDSQFKDTGMSRADFIALQAVVATRVAADKQNCTQLTPNCDNSAKPRPELFIRYGRKDCATSPNSTDDVEFPDPHRGHAHVMEVFRDGMNMTERQVVALIGAHTLGRTTPKNSGFEGPWAQFQNSLDNGFYQSLVNEIWTQNELNFNNAPAGLNPRFQWDNLPLNSIMMLNTDMSLLKNITPGANGNETNAACKANFTSCPDSSTADIVREYAMNNTRWHEDFGPAFQILMEHGYSNNSLVPAGAIHHVQSAVLVVAVSAVISLLP